MNEYIELLTKIKDTVISPITTGGTFETFKNMVLTGVIVALIACVVVAVSDNLSQVSKFFDFAKVVSILVVFCEYSGRNNHDDRLGVTLSCKSD